ncbi:Fructose-1,6-bisphosphatase class 1 [Planctomycetes bacterium Pan216]|uniref:Fructose-1,6-bisphosphatase class 1 n=1 Tax=Kolteria novifilia TaxID=2527975 RepID=A0A518BCI6_9BACT|nr:Fructose-1,6-bisphosphatase class 1 [Planctomycetes bacterium Pan216]
MDRQALTEVAGEHSVVTVQQHILRQQRLHYPNASGEFSWLLSGITLATKMIAAKVRRAGLSDVLGSVGETNVQGEQQQKLDVFANKVLIHCLGIRRSVGVLVSEENAEPIVLRGDDPHAKYAIVFDPLDGSSNIDVNVSVGTIFAIFRLPDESWNTNQDSDVLQPGRNIVAAGYVVYGSSTVLVYSTGQGVHGFTLEPAIGAYVLSHENMRLPDQGKYYSANEANFASFPPNYQQFINRLRDGDLGTSYSSRYIGSLVADFHRTLLKGGIFLYPPTESHPEGKLRLLYEAIPIAFLVEQAGGVATDGKERILDVQPTSFHQRTPLVVGSKVEAEAFANTKG